MRHGSLFSGIGGFDLAAEWMGWENVFHCEWNTFGQKVLKHYWPNAISYHDITKTDFTIHRGTIDILTGGFPCQPYSLAGKRLGKNDERHLWPEMLRAIREIKPRWIIGENVYGLVNWSEGLVFDEVQSELEAEGFEVFPYVLPAASVSAPHKRDRVWFVAYSTSNGYDDKPATQNNGIGKNNQQSWTQRERTAEGLSDEWNATDSLQIRLQQCEDGTEVGRGQKEICRQRSESSDGTKTNGEIRNAANTKNAGFETRTEGQRKEQFRRGNVGAFVSNNWQNFPTVSPVCNGDDGLSSRLDSITFPKWRNESIKAGGNAVVPQVVYQIFKTIEAYEQI